MTTATGASHLELTVSNLGPIAEGKIELRPMSVFVGPSNTGKSYLATLIYALHRFFGACLGTFATQQMPTPMSFGWRPMLMPPTSINLSAEDIDGLLRLGMSAMQGSQHGNGSSRVNSRLRQTMSPNCLKPVSVLVRRTALLGRSW